MISVMHMDVSGGTWCGISAPKRQRVRVESQVTCPNCLRGMRIAKERIEREAPKLPKRKAP